MSASLAVASSHTRSVHLLRALLREATYLPDAVARQYFCRYIVGRFKAYQPRQNATASFAVQAVEKYRHRNVKRRQLSIIVERKSQLLRKAQKGLHYLRRANQGELPCLQKVLHFAYGRMGPRKYTLLNEVLKPDPIMDGGEPVTAADLEGPTPLQKLYYSNKHYLQYFDAPKTGHKATHVINIADRYSRLRACLKTQCQKGISINRALKGHAMKTPMHNVWMRPMPIVRARNNVRRWYAVTMTRFLPPIPTDEWDDMHAMICKQKHVGLVRRRARLAAEEDEQPLDIIAKGMQLSKLSKADRPAGMWRPHNITTKFMRRMYLRIMRICCKVEYNPERKHWVATWGDSIQPVNSVTNMPPVDDALFAGVDATGKRVVEKPTEPKEHDKDLQPRNKKGEYVRFPFFAEYLPEDNPLRMELDEWKRKRRAAGIIDEDGVFRGR
jgi:hypothetical protein